MDKNLDSHKDETIDHRKKIDELHEHVGGIDSHCGGKNETKSGSCGPKGQCKESKRCDKMEDEPMDQRRESDVRNKEM